MTHRACLECDYDGKFGITGVGERIGVRAYGYARAELATASASMPLETELVPFQPKALYLSLLYQSGERSLALRSNLFHRSFRLMGEIHVS